MWLSRQGVKRWVSRRTPVADSISEVCEAIDFFFEGTHTALLSIIFYTEENMVRVPRGRGKRHDIAVDLFGPGILL